MKIVVLSLIAVFAMGSMAFAGPGRSGHGATMAAKAKRRRTMGRRHAALKRRNGFGKASDEGKAHAAPQGMEHGVGLGGGTTTGGDAAPATK